MAVCGCIRNLIAVIFLNFWPKKPPLKGKIYIKYRNFHFFIDEWRNILYNIAISEFSHY